MTAPNPLWYLTRATGIVTLVLLTASVVLGIATAVRWRTSRWPQFAVTGLHRNLSLLVLALLGVHVATTVVDGFAPIGWRDAVVPFTAGYRPVWVGLGALAVDLLVALLATSVLRRRIGPRLWRAVHWLAYAAWPVAVVHGLGTGTDVRVPWVLGLTGGCVAAVVVAGWWRIAVGWRGRPSPPRRRLVAAAAATVLLPAGLTGWALAGPLAPGWARRAGTPVGLLSSAESTPPAPPTGGPQPPSASSPPSRPGDDGRRLTPGAVGQAETDEQSGAGQSADDP